MVDELMKYAKKPETPLQILQAGLEIEIQLVVHTLHAYETHYLRLFEGSVVVSMSSLGYEGRLCNMALVSAAGAWDGLKGNIVRLIRKGGHSFNEHKLNQLLKQSKSFNKIIEPLARRHCIVHNLARVDEDYKRDVPSTILGIGDAINTNLDYVKDASESFFEIGVDITHSLVKQGLLPDGQDIPIHGGFQRDPAISLHSKLTQFISEKQNGKEVFMTEGTEYATLVEVGELNEGLAAMSSKDVALSMIGGLGGLVNKVSNAIKTLDGGGWEIVSHEITVISRHLIVSFLVKRRKGS